MHRDVQGLEQTQEQQLTLAKPDRRLKRAMLAALIVASSFLLSAQASQANTAEAQYVTFNEKVPLTSGCYKPELYDHGVNMSIKVWSVSLTTEDLRTLGVQPSGGGHSRDCLKYRPVD